MTILKTANLVAHVKDSSMIFKTNRLANDADGAVVHKGQTATDTGANGCSRSPQGVDSGWITGSSQ